MFTDAVVAIAMTLLILPLLESVSEASTEHLSATEWGSAHLGQIGSFALSFLIIGTFWMNHRALFEHVGRMTAGLAWLNLVWMLMVVWVPVATAMVGSSMTGDRLRFVLDVGPLLLASLLSVLMHRLIGARQDLWKGEAGPDANGAAVAISVSVLYALALVIGLTLPADTHFFAMLALLAMGPCTRLVRSRLLRAAA